MGNMLQVWPSTSDWKMVALYRGNATDGLSRKKWTSQKAQDKTIFHLFGNKTGGYFVDLASNDAFKLSNTWTLEQQQGWNGLCIEANPEYMGGYVHRNCTYIQAAVGPVDNEQVLFSFRNVHGGVVGSDFDNHEVNSTELTSQSLSTVSLETLFKDFAVPSVIDYLSLDIEGAEAWAFETFPWEKYIFLTITVERPKPVLQEMLKLHKYIYFCDHGTFGDQLWVHPTLHGFSKMRLEFEGKGQCRS